MNSSRLLVAANNFTSFEKMLLSHRQNTEFEIIGHRQALLQKLNSNSDLYIIELNNLSGRSLIKCLEEKNIWSIVIVKDSALLREVVSCTHTVCLYPQYTVYELHTAITKILALLKSQNEVARPVFSKQAIINPHLSKILTLREQEMLADITQGKMYKEIAETKGITLGTVKQHIHKIYNKMRVNNKIEALNMCSMGV